MGLRHKNNRNFQTRRFCLSFYKCPPSVTGAPALYKLHNILWYMTSKTIMVNVRDKPILEFSRSVHTVHWSLYIYIFHTYTYQNSWDSICYCTVFTPQTICLEPPPPAPSLQNFKMVQQRIWTVTIKTVLANLQCQSAKPNKKAPIAQCYETILSISTPPPRLFLFLSFSVISHASPPPPCGCGWYI